MAATALKQQTSVHARREPEFEKLCNLIREYDIPSVAGAANVGVATIYRWVTTDAKHQTQTPRIDTMSKVARVLGYDFKLYKKRS